MQAVRIALIQLAWSDSVESMKQQYRQLVAEAAGQDATLICLPELSLAPYFPTRRKQADREWAEPLPDGPAAKFFAELTRQHKITLVASLFEKTADGHFYDTATIHGPDGGLCGVTRKIHIPSGPGYHETDFFESGGDYPVFDIGPLHMATPTCYDQWFPELARIYALNGAQLIFYPTAIGSEPEDPDFDSSQQWQTVMRGHAIANGVFIAAANRVGEENGIRFYGSSFICDPTGEVIAQAGRDTTEVITADLDPHIFDKWRKLFPLLKQRQPHTYSRLTEADER